MPDKSYSPFKEKIYALAKQIPKGKVATYGQLATLAGSPGASRAVGMCMSTNKTPETIPCHRVVASNGKLTGYAFGGITKKKEILEKEGIKFINNNIDLKTYLWNPNN